MKLNLPFRKFLLALSLTLAVTIPAIADAGIVGAPPDGNARIQGGAEDLGIVITTTRRLAGAIDSLRWHDHEFINSTDHGR